MAAKYTHDKFRNWKGILTILTPGEKRKVGGIVLAGILAGLAELAGLASIIPAIIQIIRPEETVLKGLFHSTGLSKKEILLILLVAILILFILKNFLLYLVRDSQNKFAFNLATRLSLQNFDHFLHKDLLKMRRFNSHALVHRIKNIPFTFAGGVMLPVLLLASDIFLVLLIIIALILYNIFIFLFVLATITPLVFITYYLVRKEIRKSGLKKNDYLPLSYNAAFDIKNAFVEIKLYAIQGFFRDRFRFYQERIHHFQVRLLSLSNIPRRVVEIAGILGLLLLSFYAIFIENSFDYLYLHLAVFMAASYKLVPGVNRVFDNYLKVKAHLYTLQYLSRETYDKEEEQGEQLHFSRVIEFRNITYSWPGEKSMIAKNLAITINKGEVLGISGRSGEGKSTLLFIIMGFIDSPETTVLIDDKEVSFTKWQNYRKNIAFVGQDSFIIEGTIAENIGLGDQQQVDDQRVDEALKVAGLEEFTGKSGTLVGENGIFLSEGQKQRIAIARAVYRNAEILIFDEAMNALDKETENRIWNNIIGLSKTIIVISHHHRTLSYCSRVLVLKDGILTILNREDKAQK